MSDTCLSCIFWTCRGSPASASPTRGGDDMLGTCQHSPPTMDGTTFGRWPVTHALRWCGEHIPFAEDDDGDGDDPGGGEELPEGVSRLPIAAAPRRVQ